MTSSWQQHNNTRKVFIASNRSLKFRIQKLLRLENWPFFIKRFAVWFLSSHCVCMMRCFNENFSMHKMERRCSIHSILYSMLPTDLHDFSSIFTRDSGRWNLFRAPPDQDILVKKLEIYNELRATFRFYSNNNICFFVSSVVWNSSQKREISWFKIQFRRKKLQ